MSENLDYLFICNIDELEEKKGKRFLVNDVDVAVFKVDGIFYAVSNICPHQHAPSIYEGFIEDNCVVCPLHSWTFNLKDGKLHTGSRGLDSYNVKIIDNKLYAKVFEKKINW